MIRITVQLICGAPPAQPLEACFDPSGGTIGRAASNTLVLDDPDRTVSRVHAQVTCRDGRFFITDRGSNPMLCNGQPLGAGKEAPLAAGDRLIVGGFELSVEPVAAAAPETGVAVRAIPSDDDPFADLLAGLGSPAPAAPPRPAHAAAAPPPDLPDPFADLAPPPAAQPAGGLGALDDFSDLAIPRDGKAQSIDSLFGGLDGGAAGDPMLLSPLAGPLQGPNTAGGLDPLEALGGAGAPPTPAPRSDHLPIEQFGFVPPKAAPAAAPPPMPTPPPPLRAAPPGGDVLLAALLRGLHGMHQPPEALTPELVERIGVLLRDAVEGALQLLQARQEFKREVRAEVTMIGSQANNPIKFSPTAEIALAHLLGPGLRGFMPPGEAMRDAFDDLRAHQFGVMAGMRAALAQLIARFAPDELEKKIAARSALDGLFANRKARLWDQFVALYGSIASEAEDDFHALFGKAFVQAYEEQMKRFKG
jgi:FHA domain-containing protein